MLSLGLIGTFSGMVDMTAGFSNALSGNHADLTAKMAALLNAISGSLGFMSYAFMSSILGIGLSAFSLVAATFVSVSLAKYKDTSNKSAFISVGNQDDIDKVGQASPNENILLAGYEKKRAKESAITPSVPPQIIQQTGFSDADAQTIIALLEGIKNKPIDINFASLSSNPLIQRIDELEARIAEVNMETFKQDAAPMVVLDSINKHQLLLEKHNELLTDSIIQLNINHTHLINTLDEATKTHVINKDTYSEHNELVKQLNHSLSKNTELLNDLNNTVHKISNNSEHFVDLMNKK